MKIKVLGTGCARCHQLQETAKEVVKELAIDATVEEIKDIRKISQYPILMTPGLVINEELVCSGRALNKSEITLFIINALDKEERGKR